MRRRAKNVCAAPLRIRHSIFKIPRETREFIIIHDKNNFDQLFSDYTKLTGRLGARPTDDLSMVTRKVSLNFVSSSFHNVPCDLFRTRGSFGTLYTNLSQCRKHLFTCNRNNCFLMKGTIKLE